MQTQTNTSNNTPVHIKAQHSDEFRRFSLPEVTFESLETMLRSLFSIPSEPIKVKFLDDENDWILISSDMEFQHAVELSTSPLRIQITLYGQTPTPVPAPVQPEVPPTSEFCFQRRGCGRGMGRGRGGRGPMISKEDRIALKKARIAGRISALETVLLDPSLPAERERSISWKLENLKYKLERMEKMKETLAGEQQDEKVQEEPSAQWRHGHGCSPCDGVDQPDGEFPCRRHHCGRGRGRGGNCRRGRQEGQTEVTAETEGDHECKKWVVPKEAWSHFQECKENLKIARRSGDAEAVKVAFEAFALAKEQKKEARFPKK